VPAGRRTLIVAAAALAVCLVVAVAVIGNRHWRGGGVDQRPAAATGTSPSASPSPTPSGAGAFGKAPRSASPKPSTVEGRRPGGKPGPGNTGVPAGTKLKVVTGDQVYDKPNQVISGLDIRGFVRIRAKNVTLQNSILRGGPSPKCNSSVLFIEDGASATIKDSEIDPAHPNACLDGIWAANATLLRLDVHGAVDGVKAYDNVTMRDSWVHDLTRFASDPNQGGGPTHNDAVQTYEGNRHVTLRHNNLALGPQDNAAYQVTQDGGQPATDLHVEDNWLDGGGCTLNFAHKGGPTPMTGIFVIGNRFGRNTGYPCPIVVSTQTVLSRNSGNVYADTGQPIPPPDRHD
jgi:hypothetical protein